MIATIRLPVSDDDLLRISAENPAWQVERDASGAVIMSPTSTAGGAKSGEAFRQLANWAHDFAGGKAYDSSTGFKMPSGAVLSPDAAWISPRVLEMLPPDRRGTFWSVVPDIAIEIRSESDSWADIQNRIQGYANDGCRYAVAIDPDRRRALEIGLRPENLHLDFEAIFDA